MYVNNNNPYAQGGWFNPQNPNGEMAASTTSRRPPTYGALPSVGGSQNGWLEFRFHYSPDIFNCTVTGPQGVKAAEIRTVSGTTTLSGNGYPFSIIQWSSQPTVEVLNITHNQLASDFLRLGYSSDESYRRMEIAGKSYRWVARSDGNYLYKSGASTDLVACTKMTGLRTVVLEMKADAFPASLFQPCITATVLLYSGQNFG